MGGGSAGSAHLLALSLAPKVRWSAGQGGMDNGVISIPIGRHIRGGGHDVHDLTDRTDALVLRGATHKACGVPHVWAGRRGQCVRTIVSLDVATGRPSFMLAARLQVALTTSRAWACVRVQ